MRFGSTTLRFHWLIRRLTRGRFSFAERTDLYLSATQTAALGWLVDFAISAKDDYSERENGPRREDDILVGEEAVPRLVERALVAIREAAANGTLLQHKDLGYILYRWRDFLDGDVSEVRAWTDGMMGNDGALIVFARMMTGQSWSMGMGGFGSLGDRISMPTTTAQIDEDTEILDTRAFRAGLERIQDEATMDHHALEAVRLFLDAWDRNLRGER
jgi:hypothetical protein